MKTRHTLFIAAALLCASAVIAQQQPAPASDYAADLATVGDSQKDALQQARQLMERVESPAARAALKTAIADMEAAEKALEAAKKNPADIPAAVVVEQAAYQALLKLTPHEYRVSRSRKSSKGGGAGQPNQAQMEQLEMNSDENRYETESQAAGQPSGTQREQLEAANRLKQLSQRQQDLNDRLRELQTALQQAKTEKEQEDIKRELKHLADDERQMLSDIDDLKQKLDQSSNASSLSETSRGLDQTRAETEKAAQELANQSVSQALASGARASQSLQNLRENLRSQTSSQFSKEMRQLQNQARDLARNEEEVGRGLESLDTPGRKTLDDSRQRQELLQKIAGQQSALTNLLGNMRDLTEKAETPEPLLYEQLYDTLRRSGQRNTQSLLDAGGQLLDRGFLSKAAEAERAARTNINELRQSIDKAAETVLGSQSEALRYAQSELDDLTKQVARGAGNGKENTNNPATKGGSRQGRNSQQNGRAGQQGNEANQQGDQASQQNDVSGAQNGQTAQQSALANQQMGRQNRQAGQQSAQAGPRKGQSSQQNGKAGQTKSDGGDSSHLRELVQQMGGGAGQAGPLLGDDFANWSDRMRDVEQVVDSVDLRNRLASVRERVAGYRAEYRAHGRKPAPEEIQAKVVQPMTDIRAEILEDIARLENARSLVPLDHDPVPDNYTELVRKYYETLGGGQ